jgi:hypothetical protein
MRGVIGCLGGAALALVAACNHHVEAWDYKCGAGDEAVVYDDLSHGSFRLAACEDVCPSGGNYGTLRSCQLIEDGGVEIVEPDGAGTGIYPHAYYCEYENAPRNCYEREHWSPLP